MDERKMELAQRMAELFALPKDLVAGLCHMELLGDRELLLEGHSGILSYSEESIDISAGRSIIRICGSALVLRAMTEREVRITGRIAAVSFVH